MLMLGTASPSEIPSPVLVELFLLTGVVGPVAGHQSMRAGLVAAVGVHFWADIVSHVLCPAIVWHTSLAHRQTAHTGFQMAGPCPHPGVGLLGRHTAPPRHVP